MLDLTRLRSFVALVDAGSFTAAAKALELTKAAVSAHVRKLEDDLGCALVVRNTRRLAPTEAGMRLHASGSALLVEADRVESQAKQHVGLSGTLRLTSTNEYLSTVLAPHLASFLRTHPRLRLEIFGAPGIADVVAERFDVAVRFGHPASSALRATKLTSFRLLPVAAPALLTRYGEPKGLEELHRMPWVRHEPKARARGCGRHPQRGMEDPGRHGRGPPRAVPARVVTAFASRVRRAPSLHAHAYQGPRAHRASAKRVGLATVEDATDMHSPAARSSTSRADRAHSTVGCLKARNRCVKVRACRATRSRMSCASRTQSR